MKMKKWMNKFKLLLQNVGPEITSPQNHWLAKPDMAKGGTCQINSGTPDLYESQSANRQSGGATVNSRHVAPEHEAA